MYKNILPSMQQSYVKPRYFILFIFLCTFALNPGIRGTGTVPSRQPLLEPGFQCIYSIIYTCFTQIYLVTDRSYFLGFITISCGNISPNLVLISLTFLHWTRGFGVQGPYPAGHPSWNLGSNVCILSTTERLYFLGFITISISITYFTFLHLNRGFGVQGPYPVGHPSWNLVSNVFIVLSTDRLHFMALLILSCVKIFSKLIFISSIFYIGSGDSGYRARIQPATPPGTWVPMF